jgi:hypothetical protein
VADGIDGGFGRAVEIGDARNSGNPAVEFGTERLAAEHQMVRQPLRRSITEDGFKERWRAVEKIDLLSDQVFPEFMGRFALLVAEDNDARAVDQRKRRLLDRRIER